MGTVKRIDDIPYNLLELYKDSSVRSKTYSGGVAQKLIEEFDGRIKCEYEKLRKGAKHRPQGYFEPSHDLIYKGGSPERRKEEHLCGSLFNRCRDKKFKFGLPEGRELDIIDYQFPLKSVQKDRDGKVDLLGVAHNALCVIEVKFNNGSGGSPLAAFLEALAYCAVIEKNTEEIREEVNKKYGRFGFKLDRVCPKPELMVLAPKAYWEEYKKKPAISLGRPLKELSDKVSTALKIKTSFLSIDFDEKKFKWKPGKDVIFPEDCRCFNAVDLLK